MFFQFSQHMNNLYHTFFAKKGRVYHVMEINFLSDEISRRSSMAAVRRACVLTTQTSNIFTEVAPCCGGFVIFSRCNSQFGRRKTCVESKLGEKSCIASSKCK